MFTLCASPSLDDEEVERLRDLLRDVKSVDVNHTDLSGRSPLMLLCQCNHSESFKRCFEILFGSENYTNAAIKNGEGVNALHLLCLCNSANVSVDVVQQLISHGIDVNEVEVAGNNALHCLCANKSDTQEFVNVARHLISCGINVQAQTLKGDTALTLLFQYSNKEYVLEMAHLLALEHNVDVHHQNANGENAFHLLCQTSADIGQFIASARLLIERGIEVSSTTGKGDNGLTLLCRFFRGENLAQAVHFLVIENKMNANHTNAKGENALHYLCANPSENTRDFADVARLLMDHGVDVNTKAGNGTDNALHYICRLKHDTSLDLFLLLIDYGIDIGARDCQGDSALHHLCRY